MKQTTNRRKASRLRYRVPVRFANDSTETTSEGQMLDVSSGGLAFKCKADEHRPREGQQIVTHFSIPNSEVHDSSAMTFSRTGYVLRVQQVSEALCNVAVRFDEPLPVGKVFFDTIGLYLSNPENQPQSTDDSIDADRDKSLELALEQRINELEHELAELKQLQLRHAQSAKTTESLQE